MQPSRIPETTLELLTRSVLGELNADETAEVERLLAGSPQLRQEHALLEAAVTTVSRAADAAPGELRADQREALRAHASTQKTPGRVRWLIPLAAAATVILAAWLAIQSQSSTPDSSLREESLVALRVEGEGEEAGDSGFDTTLSTESIFRFGIPPSTENSPAHTELGRPSKLGSVREGGVSSEAGDVLGAPTSPGHIDGDSLASAPDATSARTYYEPGAVTLEDLTRGVKVLTAQESPRAESLFVSTGQTHPATTVDEEQWSRNFAITENLGQLIDAKNVDSEADRTLLALDPLARLAGEAATATRHDETVAVDSTLNSSTGTAVEGKKAVAVETPGQVASGRRGLASGGADVPAIGGGVRGASPAASSSAPHAGGSGGGGQYRGPGDPVPPGTPPTNAGDPDPALYSAGFVRRLSSVFGADGASESAPLGNLLAQAQSPGDVAQLEATLLAAAVAPSTVTGGEVVDPIQPDRSVDQARQIVDDILSRLARQQNESPDMMFFRFWGDNPSIETLVDALSTFAMDVDTASYTLVRNYLSRGTLPPKAAVRTEEFVNAFDYDLTPPVQGGEVFAVDTELGPSPFGSRGMQLLRVGIKAREVSRENRKPVSLTFVIDVSGSMDRENRLELVKQSLKLLVSQLDERDTIGIVTFQSTAQHVLAPHSITHKQLILGAIDSLHAGGSTNAGDGLLLGYQMALGQFRPDAENRILLCSDGVANTGITDLNGILRSVERYREGQIYLNSVGVGMGNHNDALLEQLADKGDGFCAYVDRLEEAKRIFVDEMVGTLQTVARDARIQVEFDPRTVRRYRRLGYENRAVADQDFRNKRIDAGEIGAGHEVSALFEIECVPGSEGPAATVRLFYQDVDSDQFVEQLHSIAAEQARGELGLTSRQFRLAASVAEFAELLRQSVWARDGSLGQVLALAEPLVPEFDQDGDVAEFVALVRQAARLPDLIPPRTELSRTMDELKRNQHLKAVLQDLQHQEQDDVLDQLEADNQRLEQRIRELLERRLGRDC